MPHGLLSGALLSGAGTAPGYETPRDAQPFTQGLLALVSARQRLDAAFGEFLTNQAEAFKRSQTLPASAPAFAYSPAGSSILAAPGGTQSGKMAEKGENEAPAGLSHPGAASTTNVATHRRQHPEEEADSEEDQQPNGMEYIGEAAGGPAMVPLPGPVVAIEKQFDELAPEASFGDVHTCSAPGGCLMEQAFATVGASSQSPGIFARGEIASMPRGAFEVVEDAPSQAQCGSGQRTNMALNPASSTSGAGVPSEPALAGSLWPALEELRERISQARQAVQEAVTEQLEQAGELFATAHEQLLAALQHAQEALGKLRDMLKELGPTLPQISGPGGSAAESARAIPLEGSVDIQGGAAAIRVRHATGAGAAAPDVPAAGKTILAAAAAPPAGTVAPPMIPPQVIAPVAAPSEDLGVELPLKTELPPVIVERALAVPPGGALPPAPKPIAVGEGEQAMWLAAPRVDRVRLVDFAAAAVQAVHARGGEIRLQLQPPELGAVHVRLQVQEGKLQAHLQAETEQARALLLEHVAALRQRLAELSIKIERFQVDLMNQQFAGSQQHTARDRHRPWQGGFGWGPAPRPPRPTKSAAVIARSHLRGGVVDLQA